MQIAAGFLLASSGSGSLMGRRFGDAEARRSLGFVPDAPVFFAGNAFDALRFAAQLSDVTPTRDAMEQVLRWESSMCARCSRSCAPMAPRFCSAHINSAKSRW
jgi:hypothetical protein